MTKKLLTLLAVLGLVASSCGGSSDEATATAASGEAPDAVVGAVGQSGDALATDNNLGTLLFADTLDQDVAPSARFDGRFSITTSEGLTVDLLTYSGAFDLETEASSMTMDMSNVVEMAAVSGAEEQIPDGFAEFLADPIEIIVIGDEAWMRWGLLSMFTGSEDAWLALGADEIGGAGDGFGFNTSAGDPTATLSALAAADAEVEDLGIETIDGIETNHFRAVVDLAGLSEGLDPAELAEAEAQLGSLDTAEFPIDVWLGVEDGLIYRYSMEIDGASVLGAMDSADVAADIASAVMVFEFSDYGADVEIVAPPADEVVDGQGLIGGA